MWQSSKFFFSYTVKNNYKITNGFFFYSFYHGEQTICKVLYYVNHIIEYKQCLAQILRTLKHSRNYDSRSSKSIIVFLNFLTFLFFTVNDLKIAYTFNINNIIHIPLSFQTWKKSNVLL